MTLCVADKRPGIDGVVYLLVVERLARYVDGLKPRELLRRFALAHIDSERVFEYALLYVGLLVSELEMDERVFLPGRKTRDVLAEFYEDADVFALVSKRETFGVSDIFFKFFSVEAYFFTYAVQNVGCRHVKSCKKKVPAACDAIICIARLYMDIVPCISGFLTSRADENAYVCLVWALVGTEAYIAVYTVCAVLYRQSAYRLVEFAYTGYDGRCKIFYFGQYGEVFSLVGCKPFLVVVFPQHAQEFYNLVHV